MVAADGSLRTPPPRNVAAVEAAIADSLKSATLWGGETRHVVLPCRPDQ
jgi:hypothetical protein